MCHRVQLAALSSMQCILPHPEVLHRSTQPAIFTARRAPTNTACVSLDIGVATRDQHKVALAGISCLQCIFPHPEVLHRSTQPAIITTRRAPTSNMQQLSLSAYAPPTLSLVVLPLILPPTLPIPSHYILPSPLPRVLPFHVPPSPCFMHIDMDQIAIA